MKINPRYYPVIVIVTYVVFFLLGLLLGFGPEHGGGHGRGALMRPAYLSLESFV